MVRLRDELQPSQPTSNRLADLEPITLYVAYITRVWLALREGEATSWYQVQMN